jgi:hypothetical protein
LAAERRLADGFRRGNGKRGFVFERIKPISNRRSAKMRIAVGGEEWLAGAAELCENSRR